MAKEPSPMAVDDMPSSVPDPASAITELQEVFGHILLSQKDRKKAKTTNTSNPTSPPAYPRWTGAFELFSFPRELRDRIFYHYLYRPKGIKYRRKTQYVFPFEPPADVTSLFLTSRQVYDEALQVFCRYNQINIPRRSSWRKYATSIKAISGTLRLFPDKPARLLQRLRVDHPDSSAMYVSRDHTHVNAEFGDQFVHMLREAYTFRNTFPKLRECTVMWQLRALYSDTHTSVDLAGTRDEEIVRIWAAWMREWVKDAHVVPPKWVGFEFRPYWGGNEGLVHKALVGAYARLVKETVGWKDESADLEESGRRWLEEMEGEDRKKGKKNRSM